MGALSAVIGGKANQGGGETFTRNERNVHPNAAVSRAFRALSPRKTWLLVAERLGLLAFGSSALAAVFIILAMVL